MLLSLQINALIEDFRKSIPIDSATARAIDRKDSRRKILLYAKAEGHLKFAQDLERALNGKPPHEQADEKQGFPIFANSKVSST